MANTKITDRQRRFVQEYLKEPNATKAAERAGYSKKTARSQGTRLLTNVAIQELISTARKERSERTSIDADYVLKRLAEIDSLDVVDILDDTGKIKPVMEWPKVWRTSISGVDIQELMTGDIDSVIRKIKWPDKTKNLELLGKHVDVQAFKESVDHNLRSVKIVDLTGES